MWGIFFVVFLMFIVFPIHSKENVAVLILARGGSKGIRLKNLQTVGNLSLLAHAIVIAKQAGLHDVTVSTDHPIIALESIKYGAGVFRRSRITATDWAPSIWGVSEFISHRKNVDTFILIQATSPFIKSIHLQKALRKLGKPKPYDCIFSATRNFKLRWRKDNEKLYSANFKSDNRPRRQDWDGELLETGAFYIMRRALIEDGKLQNNKYKMSTTPEITFEDLEATDVISVELVPERKGLILKHCEYYVSSRRHGTTVTRRYNEFAQLYDVLYAKYPYRAVCRLPPKRVVVGGGSPLFLQRRRVALQRWLTLVARHPVLAHDADLRTFLCETSVRLDKPKHDEFVLAGTQEDSPREASTEEMQELFQSEQEQLRLVQLGLARLFKIFEKAERRCEAERVDVRELGAGLLALSAPAPATVRGALRSAAQLVEMQESEEEGVEWSDGGDGCRMSLALDALSAYRELCSRLTRGLHAERAAAAHAAPAAPAAAAATRRLRARHRYALAAAVEEARVARAYALAALEALPVTLRALGGAHARAAALWTALAAAWSPGPKRTLHPA